MDKLKYCTSKKIIVFNKNEAAGVSTILKNIIIYSKNNEISYKLILYSFDNEAKNSIYEDWCEEVERIQLSSYDNIFHTVKLLKRIIEPNSIIVANDLLELRMVVLLKLKNPLIYIIHGDFETYYKHCEMFQDYIDIIIAYSKHIVDKLNILLKSNNKNKIKLIYYPTPEIHSTERNESIIKISFAGSLIKRKGVYLLPEIIDKLDEAHLEYNFEIIGSGEEEFWLKNQLGNNPSIHFLGQKKNSEVIDHFKNADILLFPTQSEGLPNVLIEAMKAGCVPVVSNIESGIPDVIKHGIHGFLIDPKNTKGFADAIIELYNDRNTLKKVRNNAIFRTNEMFNPNINAKAYYDTFLSVHYKARIINKPIPLGPILNKSYIPNRIVRIIRKFKISPHL